MSIRPNTTTARRETWRHRFLEIARRYEAVEDRAAQPLGISGLRPRATMAGFATLRRTRPGAAG
jgi:hypothetical protein